MFRAQQNPFDDVVAKATDENLTSENWEYIMDVCDKVSSEDSGAKDAVASMIKRLAHRNANVQLYTLELANALSQNCGAKMHRELASRAFTDALLRLAADRNIHHQVKAKILERMQEWAEMFKDPDLGIMRDQYQKLKSQNPNLHPPSAPSKSRLTDLDRQKEEEELQIALKLSIQDKPPQINPAQQAECSGQPVQAKSATPAQAVPSGTTAATVSRVRALFDFQASDPDELTFRKGDIIAVLESVYKDWWKGLLRGQTGIFPLNYVEKLADPTPDDVQRELQMEAEVFAEIKNVEKLLTLLSTSSSDLNIRDNEEIGKLYHSTLAIRPKLIELIGKYSQKKDEFTQLNERFIKSCRDYESLLDVSMTQAQPPYHQYGRQSQYGYPPQATPAQQEPQGYYNPNVTKEHNYPPQPLSSPQGYPSSQPQTGHRPQSTFANPQELATSTFDSPMNQKNPNSLYGASGYSQDDTYSTGPSTKQPPTAQHQYSAYTPLKQPSRDPPTHPSNIPPPSLTAGYPVISQAQDARQTLPNQDEYKSYQRPGLGQGPSPSAPPGNPSDYYRQSAAN